MNIITVNISTCSNLSRLIIVMVHFTCQTMAMMLFSLFTVTASGIVLLTSSSTPKEVQAALSTTHSQDVHNATASLIVNDYDTLFDYTYNQFLSALESKPTTRFVKMWPSLGDENRNYAQSFGKYVQAMNFSQVLIVTDSSLYHVKTGTELKRLFPSVFNPTALTVPSDLSLEAARNLVGKVIKPTGASVFAILVDSKVAIPLLKAFENAKCNRSGYVFVISDSARLMPAEDRKALSLLDNGVLSVAREEIAAAQTRTEAEHLLFLNAFNRASEGEFSEREMRFVLVNAQHSTFRLIASDPEELSSSGIIFPGNTTVRPVFAKATIPISANYDLIDPTGKIHPLSKIIMRGMKFAFEQLPNRSDILPNFRVEDRSISLSGLNFNRSFTYQRTLAAKDRLGLTHFITPLGYNIIQTYSIFEELGISMPLIANSMSYALANSTAYPNYLRTRASSKYQAFVVIQLLRLFQWRKFAILYSEDSADYEEYYHFLQEQFADNGYIIFNDEKLRGIPPDLTSQAGKTALNSSIINLQQSPARIVFILHQSIDTILDTMYDLGIRSQYLLITVTGLSTMLLNNDPDKGPKRRIVAKGALQFMPRTFLEAEGARVLKYLKSVDGANYYPNTCYFYDSAMLYIYAVDYMVRQSLDYESTEETLKAMRATRFQGCAGSIRIREHSNERAEEEFVVFNTQQSGNTTTVDEVMYFNPFSVTLFKQAKKIQWPDDSDTVFTDTLMDDFDCPFSRSQVREFLPGVIVGVCVSAVTLLLTVAVAVYAWYRKRRSKYPLLKVQQEVSVDDMLHLLAVPVEFLQLAAFGPDLSVMSRVMAELNISAILNQGMRHSFLFKLYYSFGYVGFYVLMCLIKYLRLEDRLETLPLFSFLILFVNLLLPATSTLLFLPVVHTLSQTFLCYEAIGDSFTSSFLNTDCSLSCWSNIHFLYAILAAFGLLVYIPIALFSMPIWQELQPNLHLRMHRVPLLTKSILQVILVAISNSLKAKFPTAHAGLFLAVVGAYLAFLLKSPMYNYSRSVLCRLNLWYDIAVLSLLPCSVSVLLSDYWGLFVFAGVECALVVGGLVLQCTHRKFSSKLSRRRRDPSNIINFAFSFGQRAQVYLNRFLSSAPDFDELDRASYPDVNNAELIT